MEKGRVQQQRNKGEKDSKQNIEDQRSQSISEVRSCTVS